MPEYLSPGVYIEEVEIGPKPIEGVSTSTAGFLGETERGPTLPTPVTSWLEYQRIFGDYFGKDKYLPYAIDGFFRNGGQRCYVARIVKMNATKATVNPKASGSAVTMNAIGEGSWGNRVVVKISQIAADGTFKITAFYWKQMPAALFDPEFDGKSQPRPSMAESFNVALDKSSSDYYVSKVNLLSNLIQIVENSTLTKNLLQGINGTAAGVAKSNVAGPYDTLTLAAGTPNTLTAQDLWVKVTDDYGQRQVTAVLTFNAANNQITVDPQDCVLDPKRTYTYELYWLQTLTLGLDDGVVSNETLAVAFAVDPYKTVALDGSASGVDDYKNDSITITGGVGAGQVKTVAAYDKAKKVVTVDKAWTVVPDATSAYSVKHSVASDKVVAAGTTKKLINLGAAASAVDDAYKDMTLEVTDAAGVHSGVIASYVAATQIAALKADLDVVPADQTPYAVYSMVQGAVLAGVPDPYFSISLKDNVALPDAGCTIQITAGTGKGQSRIVQGISAAAPWIATVDQKWDTIPDATSKYLIDDPTSGLVPADFERADTNQPGKKQALTGFAEIEDISIVYSPNSLQLSGVTDLLISHCENLKDRFLIIDARSAEPMPVLPPTDSEYAAFYYPWINIVDAATGLTVLVPPGGFMAGVYAGTDTDRGVFKAPANVTVSGADSTQFIINKGMQDLLNPKGVNCIRSFSGGGVKIWGARTMSSDPLWKYINVRRFFIFIEKSIEQGTQWVVFEPNNEKLWARVIQTISQFLTTQWKSGALMGMTPEQAFFVKCDRTTMTQDDIDNGRLVVMVGLATTKPAEFVIFRIAQWQGGSAATE